MPDQVDLHVRVAGAQGVEFALRRAGAGSWRVVGALLGVGAALALSAAAFWLWERRTTAAGACGALGVALALAWKVWGAAVVEEALVVVPSLGVQLRKTRRSGAVSTKFVDAREICAVVVHEAITFADVPYLLGFLLDKQDDHMLLAFEEFRPRIGVLKEIYRCTKRILFPHDGQDNTEKELQPRKMRLPERLQAALDET